jgi:hypothetical protein
MVEISIVLELEIKTSLSFCNNQKNFEIISEKNFPIFNFSNYNMSKQATHNSKMKKKSLPLLDPKIKLTYRTPLRGYWSLELVFLDGNLANHGFEDIIRISQFVDLAFSLRQKCVKTFLYVHTP